jgi:hypothetical protein
MYIYFTCYWFFPQMPPFTGYAANRYLLIFPRFVQGWGHQCKFEVRALLCFRMYIDFTYYYFFSKCHLRQVMLPTIFIDFPGFVEQWGHRCRFEAPNDKTSQT